MALSVEYQAALRRLYDNGENRAQAAKKLGISEATVTRYFGKWEALRRAVEPNPYVIDLTEMFEAKMIQEIEIEARMRCMSVQGYMSAIFALVIKDKLSASILDLPEYPKTKKVGNENV